MSDNKVYVFKRFERFWHWSQAALIIVLLATGFEVHGSWDFLGFERAVRVHTIGAWSLVSLWVFAIFWHLTTGEWRQYLPTLDKMGAVVRHYSIGIFKGEPHPFRPTPLRKHNPLQRLAYLFVLVFVGPLIWLTGWFYLFYDQWRAWGLDQVLSLQWVASLHTAGAFLILVFLVAHVYLITTGHTLTAHLKAMITGWDDSPPATGEVPR